MKHTSCQATRDLLWVVNSPPLLITDQDRDDPIPEHQRLQQADIDAEHLNHFFTEHRSRRVGRYFEALVSYWLKHIRRVEIVAESETIYEGQRSVGEIDFIFFDEQGRLTHWEVAVKFYLFHSMRQTIPGQFIGPNARDTLEQKRQKMLERQLPLSLNHFPAVKVRYPFLKGRLFYHEQDQWTRTASEQISIHHLTGHWCRNSELAAYLQALFPQVAISQPSCHERHQVKFRLLEKPFWLADEIVNEDDGFLLTPESMLEMAKRHFRSSNRCLLVAHLVQTGDSYFEAGRFFVVPETWPEPRDSH